MFGDWSDMENWFFKGDFKKWLPAEPLRQYLFRVKDARQVGLQDVAHTLEETMGLKRGIKQRHLERLKTAKHIGWIAADEICIALGIHPMDIWPKEWCTIYYECIGCHTQLEAHQFSERCPKRKKANHRPVTRANGTSGKCFTAVLQSRPESPSKLQQSA